VVDLFEFKLVQGFKLPWIESIRHNLSCL